EVGPLFELVPLLLRKEGADVFGRPEQIVDRLNANEDGRPLLGGAVGLVGGGERGRSGQGDGQYREAVESRVHGTSWGIRRTWGIPARSVPGVSGGQFM